MPLVDYSRIRSDLIFEVAEVNPVSKSIVEIVTEPGDHDPLEFLPGQYVLLEDVEHQLEPRSYSIANSPRRDGSLTFLVTLVPEGQLTSWIHEELGPGDQFSVSGPYGTFTAEKEKGGPVLYLTAGSGLAPARALLEAGFEDDPDRPRTLVFSARTEDDVLDRDRFEEWREAYPGFRFIRTLTRGKGPGPQGRVPGLLEDLSGDLAGYEIYIAGGPGFVSSCTAAAERCGADRSRIRTEPFFVEPRPRTTAAAEEGGPDDP
ncbi:MAG: hypothetical protein JJE13_08255 [Thermoleophilia bacterium]|nr:hypothetical protein [Thermoleophilia bacterium]